MVRGRPFAKGNNANPGGRPKVATEVRELAGEYSKEAVLKLVELMRSSADEKTQRAAAVDIIERAAGKPMQPVEHGGVDGEALGIEIVFVNPGDDDDDSKEP